jgi:hypothetical protein
MRAGIAGVAYDWVRLCALVETYKRDGDKSKILDGEDGKCAGYVAEVGERERRAEEGICPGRIGT